MNAMCGVLVMVASVMVASVLVASVLVASVALGRFVVVMFPASIRSVWQFVDRIQRCVHQVVVQARHGIGRDHGYDYPKNERKRIRADESHDFFLIEC